jgi:hypothetical protein
MERVSPALISSAILAAPGWARVGITMPDDRMREQAAEVLARSILGRLERADAEPDPDQLTLPI